MTEEKEKTWTSDCQIIFNSLKISHLTITDHFIKSGHDKHGINRKLIQELMEKLSEIPIMKPKKRYINRDVYVWEKVPHQGKKYLLIFWFKDDSKDHLWVRTCYPQTLKKKWKEVEPN